MCNPLTHLPQRDLKIIVKAFLCFKLIVSSLVHFKHSLDHNDSTTCKPIAFAVVWALQHTILTMLWERHHLSCALRQKNSCMTWHVCIIFHWMLMYIFVSKEPILFVVCNSETHRMFCLGIQMGSINLYTTSLSQNFDFIYDMYC